MIINMTTSRRALLTTLAAATVGVPLINELTGNVSRAAATESADGPEKFGSNTELYASSLYHEGEDWARRFGRAQPVDNYRDVTPAMPLTAVIAPHGGAIEPGTSELCMTIAGYTMAGAVAKDDPTPPPGPTPLGGGIPARDYWMFEALVNAPRNELHVTSTHCDDPAALSIVGGSKYAVSLHGYTPPVDTDPVRMRILIGGRDGRLMRNLFDRLCRTFDSPARPVTVEIAGSGDRINGDDPTNIVNRTYSGAGAQLEISTELRTAMFGSFATGSERRRTAGQGDDQAYYWNGFVNAVRTAIARNESGYEPPIPTPIGG